MSAPAVDVGAAEVVVIVPDEEEEVAVGDPAAEVVAARELWRDAEGMKTQPGQGRKRQ